MKNWKYVGIQETTDFARSFKNFEKKLNDNLSHFLSNIEINALDIFGSGYTANRLIQSNPSEKLTSVTNLTNFVYGTTYQIEVTAYTSAGTAQINLPNLVKMNTAYIGNSTSYSEFESDGTLVFRGDATVWEDLNFNAVATAVGASAPSIISYSTSNIKMVALDGGAINEELNASVETPHATKAGSSITAHVHWCPTTTGTGNVEFLLDYYLIRTGTVLTSGTASVIDSSTGAAWAEKRLNITTISSTGIGQGTQCLFRLYRVPGSSNDTYGADAGIFTWGFHYEIDTVGSRQITSK